MKQFGKPIMTIMGIIFGAVLLGFNAYETFTFLVEVTGNPIIAFIGLVMFEGGFLYWAAEFKQNAEGLMQMAIALLTSVLDFVAVVLAVALRLGAVDASIMGESTGAKLVIAAVLVNLSAKYVYGLSHPDTLKNIMKRATEGLAVSRTYKAFNSKILDSVDTMADTMAVEWLNEFEADFKASNATLRSDRGLAGELFRKARERLQGKKEATDTPEKAEAEGDNSEPTIVPAQTETDGEDGEQLK